MRSKVRLPLSFRSQSATAIFSSGRQFFTRDAYTIVPARRILSMRESGGKARNSRLVESEYNTPSV